MEETDDATITIVNIADLPLEGVQRGRVNMIRRKRLPLETGVPGVTCEFSLSIVPEGYFTPRHRHNFDQIRYTLTGVQSTGHGDLAPGEIGYFPEGRLLRPAGARGRMHDPGAAIPGRERRASACRTKR